MRIHNRHETLKRHRQTNEATDRRHKKAERRRLLPRCSLSEKHSGRHRLAKLRDLFIVIVILYRLSSLLYCFGNGAGVLWLFLLLLLLLVLLLSSSLSSLLSLLLLLSLWFLVLLWSSLLSSLLFFVCCCYVVIIIIIIVTIIIIVSSFCDYFVLQKIKDKQERNKK